MHRAVPKNVQVRSHDERLNPKRVSELISQIGEAAGIIVKTPREDEQGTTKYASAHDLRRACAQRLINAGVSAVTFKVILRHENFSSTEKFYGATRQAQSAASELHTKLNAECTKTKLVGGTDDTPTLTADELKKLKRLINSI